MKLILLSLNLIASAFLVTAVSASQPCRSAEQKVELKNSPFFFKDLKVSARTVAYPDPSGARVEFQCVKSAEGAPRWEYVKDNVRTIVTGSFNQTIDNEALTKTKIRVVQSYSGCLNDDLTRECSNFQGPLLEVSSLSGTQAIRVGCAEKDGVFTNAILARNKQRRRIFEARVTENPAVATNTASATHQIDFNGKSNNPLSIYACRKETGIIETPAIGASGAGADQQPEKK